MSNKKGFTMVEVLTVLVLLSMIIVLVVPAITSSTNKAKQKLYDTKIKFLEDAAYLYAQDNYASIIINCKNLETGEMLPNCDYFEGDSNKISYTIPATTLIPEYYKPDSDEPGKMIEDPRYTDKYLDNTKFDININKLNRKINVQLHK